MQIISPEDVVQERLVDFGLLQELLNPGLVLVASDTPRDGKDVLRPEHFRRDSVILDRPGFADRFFGESGGGEELDWEPVNHEMLALHAPAVLRKCA